MKLANTKRINEKIMQIESIRQALLIMEPIQTLLKPLRRAEL